jgi:hypothetical protein
LGGADNNNLNAGKIYGVSNAPIHPGSGGRGYDHSSGSGGGLVRVEALEVVRVDGTIQAQGQGFSSSYSGAGSGGGIYIRCARFAGGAGGLLNVAGGTGGSTGNSGGGGRIAVWRGLHLYQGSVIVSNGAPVAAYALMDAPQPGTVFWGQLPNPGVVIILQ